MFLSMIWSNLLPSLYMGLVLRPSQLLKKLSFCKVHLVFLLDPSPTLKIIGWNPKSVERDQAVRPVYCSLSSVLFNVIIFDLVLFIFKNLADDLGASMWKNKGASIVSHSPHHCVLESSRLCMDLETVLHPTLPLVFNVHSWKLERTHSFFF